nr:MAG TPA: hypothetical protein [Caudoviricetes sp.]
MIFCFCHIFSIKVNSVIGLTVEVILTIKREREDPLVQSYH